MSFKETAIAKLNEMKSGAQGVIKSTIADCITTIKWIPDDTETQLSQFKKAQSEGRLLILPCKIGDPVFVVGSKIRAGSLEDVTAMATVMRLYEVMEQVGYPDHIFSNADRLAAAKFLAANGVAVQQWIPVTERLPEDYLPKDSKVKQIKVLVAYKTNGRWVERTQIRVKGYYYGDPDKWSWVKTSDPISHWMPLLEMPKDG